MLCWRFHSGDLYLVTLHDGRSQLRKREAEHMVHIWGKKIKIKARNWILWKVAVASETQNIIWRSSIFLCSSLLSLSLQLFVNCLTHQGRHSIPNQSLSSSRVSTLLQHQLLSSHPGFPLARRGEREEGERRRRWWWWWGGSDEEHRSSRRGEETTEEDNRCVTRGFTVIHLWDLERELERQNTDCSLVKWLFVFLFLWSRTFGRRPETSNCHALHLKGVSTATSSIQKLMHQHSRTGSDPWGLYTVTSGFCKEMNRCALA